MIRDVLEDFLLFSGHHVIAVANGELALQAIEEKRPDIVLLDQNMPVLDGTAVSKTLRERGMQLPILAMSAKGNVRKWAREIGAGGYLAKPFDLSELERWIERIGGVAEGSTTGE